MEVTATIEKNDFRLELLYGFKQDHRSLWIQIDHNFDHKSFQIDYAKIIEKIVLFVWCQSMINLVGNPGTYKMQKLVAYLTQLGLKDGTINITISPTFQTLHLDAKHHQVKPNSTCMPIVV